MVTILQVVPRLDAGGSELSTIEIAQALSWQPHTVRGAMAGALKKKLGLDVISEKDEKRGRIYRITNRD